MELFLEVGKLFIGPEPGVKLLLFICLGLVLWAYWNEKNKNDEVADIRLEEAREDTESLMTALNEASSTLKEYKSSNEALKSAFDSLSAVIKSNHETIALLISRSGRV
jgi:cell division GTPase FtsZ